VVTVTWSEYPVILSYPSGITEPGSVRAISRRDATWRADRRWPPTGPILWTPHGWEARS
jgi:hypothetical protein